MTILKQIAIQDTITDVKDGTVTTLHAKSSAALPEDKKDYTITTKNGLVFKDVLLPYKPETSDIFYLFTDRTCTVRKAKELPKYVAIINGQHVSLESLGLEVTSISRPRGGGVHA